MAGPREDRRHFWCSHSCVPTARMVKLQSVELDRQRAAGAGVHCFPVEQWCQVPQQVS